MHQIAEVYQIQRYYELLGQIIYPRVKLIQQILNPAVLYHQHTSGKEKLHFLAVGPIIHHSHDRGLQPQYIFGLDC
jgi:hypothetical protein